MKNFIVIFFLILSISFFGDLEAQKINGVKIGGQVWSEKNLDVVDFQNGEKIQEAKTYLEWKKACESRQPAWCFFKFTPINGIKFGKLYNWFAIVDSREIAPAGWEIPAYSDFEVLENAIKDPSNKIIKEQIYNSSITVGYKLKSKTDWKVYQGQNGNGNDQYNFNAIPGGYVWLTNVSKTGYIEGIDFLGKGEETYFWTKDSDNFNYHLSNGWFSSETSGFVPPSASFCCKETFGFYIRCIQQ
jgi:uncharacterized protein (TIGR02145 family)